MVHELLERGIDHRQIRRTIERLRERYGHDWPLTHAQLATSDGKLVTEADKAIYDTGGRGWQQLHIEDLRRIADDLQRGGWAARSLPLRHIEVNPNRLSGRPVIRGTRVSAELVAELAQAPDGLETLSEGYGITDEEAKDALAWWCATQEYEAAAA